MTHDANPPAEGVAPAWRSQWSLPPDVTYLNHGSFGPSPLVVQDARHAWSQRLERQPMDFFLRHFEEELDQASRTLADFVGADAGDLVFVDNATTGMNIVAASVELRPGDEVLLTDHEYGAVVRIWRNACRRAGAALVTAPLPSPLESPEATADAVLSAVTPRTRLIVVSHVTSPTAVILPVDAVCRRARELGVVTCIDGPHAVAMVPLHIAQLGCDYYVASCHKWLSAPFGTGFLYVTPRRQQTLTPVITSWGGSVSGRPPRWQDEFNWSGTRDPSACLAVPAAIEFLHRAGVDNFRHRTHALAQYARHTVQALTQLEALVPDSPDWYASMISMPLPDSVGELPKGQHRHPLQDALWARFRIEAPIIDWHSRRFIRVSCHLYNSESDVDRLVNALRELIV